MARRKKVFTDDPLDIVVEKNLPELIDDTKYLEPLKCHDLPFCLAPYFVMLIDLSRRKFLYISNSVEYVLGYTQNELMSEDLSFLFSQYHPDTLATQRSLYQTIVEFYNTIPVRSRIRYFFSYNLEIKHKNGNYLHLLLYNRCIKYDTKNNPRLIFSICTDISAYSSTKEQILTISKISSKGFKQILKTNFYCEYERGILTRKEVEIWNYIQKGYTGKEIASMLNISIHTVNTHRKKIYKKLRNVNSNEATHNL
jgi:DNA-binding CsgD family transcriptional regulator